MKRLTRNSTLDGLGEFISIIFAVSQEASSTPEYRMSCAQPSKYNNYVECFTLMKKATRAPPFFLLYFFLSLTRFLSNIFFHTNRYLLCYTIFHPSLSQPRKPKQQLKMFGCTTFIGTLSDTYVAGDR